MPREIKTANSECDTFLEETLPMKLNLVLYITSSALSYQNNYQTLDRILDTDAQKFIFSNFIFLLKMISQRKAI